MNSAWWKIAKLELVLAFRDRESLMWSLVAPIAMAWIFGSMFDSKPPAPTRVTINAGMNPPYVAFAFADLYKENGMTVGEDGIEVTLPDSLIQRLASGRDVAVRVVQGEASDNRARAVAERAREGVYRLAFQAPALAANPDSALIDTSSVGGVVIVSPKSLSLRNTGPLFLASRPLGVAPRIIDGRERQLPAMLIMFVMFQVMTFFLQLWVEDLRTGKIKRIVMSPTLPRDLLLGQLVARVLWAMLQVLVILGAGSLVMGVRLSVNWLHFGVLIVTFTITAASIGVLAGSFFKSSEKAGAIGVMLSLVMAALGGCWWPLEIVPGPMRAVAKALPTGQAMEGIANMMAVGPSAPFPLLNVIVLVAMTLVVLPLATRRMKIQLVG